MTGRKLPTGLDGELHTMRDWLRYATSLFAREELTFGQGAASAFDEALWLVLHTLHLPRDGWEIFLDARLVEDEKFDLMTVLERRAFAREPAAYITGEAWLGEYSFRCDKRAIIPRSYFLEIIPEQLNEWLSDPEAVTRVADVCTGSGCLAILLALAYPNAVVDATDISGDALELAALNVGDYGLEGRVVLHRADVLEGVGEDEDGDGDGDPAAYDIIVCNPPYEPELFLKTLPEEFRHEPSGALVSGADGLDVIRKLLPQAMRKLAPNGVLLVEVGGLRDVLEANFPKLEINWLSTKDGTDCIALFHATELRRVF